MSAGVWLECVPNLSLGRSRRAVDKVVRGLGEALLDVHRDRDHDRTVLTLFAPERDLEATLFEVADRALAEIDLSRNRGVHPRVGALDVVPFVPVEGASEAAAQRAADHFARRFSRRYGIPVFRYSEAAGRSLPELRRGGLAAAASGLRAAVAPASGRSGSSSGAAGGLSSR